MNTIENINVYGKEYDLNAIKEYSQDFVTFARASAKLAEDYAVMYMSKTPGNLDRCDILSQIINMRTIMAKVTTIIDVYYDIYKEFCDKGDEQMLEERKALLAERKAKLEAEKAKQAEEYAKNDVVATEEASGNVNEKTE